MKGSIPRKSASLLLLRPTPPSKVSFFDYDILLLQRTKNMSFGSALVFPGGKLEPQIDQQHHLKYSLRGNLESAALRETFEETGLFFPRQPLLESSVLRRLEEVRLEYIANTFQEASKAKVRSYQQLSDLLRPSQSLAPFIRMITVPALKRRYDATFFVLALEDYKYVNFAKYAEHEKHLHNLEDIVHCPHEYTNFRWMNPAEILQMHFSRTAVVAPPQFIMLNIMLSFTKKVQFMEFLKSHNPPDSQFNPNLGPNVISLLRNRGNLAETYPFAATLVGDREFPYNRIIETESCEELRRQIREWRDGLADRKEGVLNRFLFKENKLFFESEYEVECRDGQSVIEKMQGWRELREMLDKLTI